MSEKIIAKTLKEARDKRKGKKASNEDIELLKKWQIVDEENTVLSDNLEILGKVKNDDLLMLVDSTLTVVMKKDEKSGEGGSKKTDGKKEEKNKNDEEDVLFDFNSGSVKNDFEADEVIHQSSFAVDVEKLKSQLEAYLQSIPKEAEGYFKNEVKIYHFGATPSNVANNLIAAGTKVLDALIYCANTGNVNGVNIFYIESVSELPTSVVAKNLDIAKKAIKAGVVLFWTQGNLPHQKQDQAKQISKFVKDFIYNDSSVTGVEIARHLSSVSTMKFPGSVFLDVDIDLMPVPVASRCKLSIAGNRCVRYAAYASPFAHVEEKTVSEGMNANDIANMMSKNQRISLMKGIVEFLISLQGNHKAQARMHPASKSKPVVKNLTLKMTRIIIEYLTPSGRASLAGKISSSSNSAFMIDKNFFGVEIDGVRTWPILNNTEADFKDLSVAALKGYYGVA